jgi:hypothetical protein
VSERVRTGFCLRFRGPATILFEDEDDDEIELALQEVYIGYQGLSLPS